MRVVVAAPPAATPAPPPRPAGPAAVNPNPFRGYYRRWSDSSVFQPCGDPKYYPVVGRGEPLGQLRERYRFTMIYLGRPVFTAMRGDFVVDTMRTPATMPGDTATMRIVRRFFVTKLDTLRTRSEGDCRGVRGAAR